MDHFAIDDQRGLDELRAERRADRYRHTPTNWYQAARERQAATELERAHIAAINRQRLNDAREVAALGSGSGHVQHPGQRQQPLSTFAVYAGGHYYVLHHNNGAWYGEVFLIASHPVNTQPAAGSARSTPPGHGEVQRADQQRNGSQRDSEQPERTCSVPMPH